MAYTRAILAQCGRKKRYPTAAAAAVGMAVRTAAGALGLSVYQCRYCLAFHFGKRKNWWVPRATPDAPLIVPIDPKARRERQP